LATSVTPFKIPDPALPVAFPAAAPKFLLPYQAELAIFFAPYHKLLRAFVEVEVVLVSVVVVLA
jgi:hypothetical protein